MQKRYLAIAALALLCTLPEISAAERVQGGNTAKNLTVDTNVDATSGDIVGIFVAQSTGCTIKIWDNTAASGTVLVNTFAATAATWYPLPFHYVKAMFVDVTGTCDLTVSYFE